MQGLNVEAIAFNPAGHCLNCKYRGCFGPLLLIMAVVLALVDSVSERLSQELAKARTVFTRGHRNGDHKMG